MCLLQKISLDLFPWSACIWIGFKVTKPLLENVTMPLGDWHAIRFGCDPVPKPLDVLNLLVDI